MLGKGFIFFYGVFELGKWKVKIVTCRIIFLEDVRDELGLVPDWHDCGRRAKLNVGASFSPISFFLQKSRFLIATGNWARLVQNFRSYNCQQKSEMRDFNSDWFKVPFILNGFGPRLDLSQVGLIQNWIHPELVAPKLKPSPNRLIQSWIYPKLGWSKIGSIPSCFDPKLYSSQIGLIKFIKFIKSNSFPNWILTNWLIQNWIDFQLSWPKTGSIPSWVYPKLDPFQAELMQNWIHFKLSWCKIGFISNWVDAKLDSFPNGMMQNWIYSKISWFKIGSISSWINPKLDSSKLMDPKLDSSPIG